MTSFILHCNVKQECSDIFLQREEDEHVIAQNSKQAESLVYYKRNTPSYKLTVPQCTTSQHRCECSKFTWQVLVIQECLLALPDARSFVLRCCPRLTVEEGHVAFQFNSWVMRGRLYLDCFAATFTCASLTH